MRTSSGPSATLAKHPAFAVFLIALLALQTIASVPVVAQGGEGGGEGGEGEGEECVPGSDPLDMDCDGILDPVGCVPGSDPLDMDCDGLPDEPAGCVPGGDPSDMDCDDIDSSVDCDDGNVAVGAPGPGQSCIDNVIVDDSDGDLVANEDDLCNAPAFGGGSDNDGDGCFGVAQDCDDNDSLVFENCASGGPGGGSCTVDADPTDMDCDFVLSDVDCNDDDPTNTRTMATDGDCDGVLDSQPDLCTTPIANFGLSDVDGDGCFGAEEDCDDTNGNVATDCSTGCVRDTDPTNMDCDVQPQATDCNDGDSGDTRSNEFDADCDNVVNDDDLCDDTPGFMREDGDNDGDGCFGIGQDCDDNDGAQGPTCVDPCANVTQLNAIPTMFAFAGTTTGDAALAPNDGFSFLVGDDGAQASWSGSGIPDCTIYTVRLYLTGSGGDLTVSTTSGTNTFSGSFGGSATMSMAPPSGAWTRAELQPYVADLSGTAVTVEGLQLQVRYGPPVGTACVDGDYTTLGDAIDGNGDCVGTPDPCAIFATSSVNAIRSSDAQIVTGDSYGAEDGGGAIVLSTGTDFAFDGSGLRACNVHAARIVIISAGTNGAILSVGTQTFVLPSGNTPQARSLTLDRPADGWPDGTFTSLPLTISGSLYSVDVLYLEVDTGLTVGSACNDGNDGNQGDAIQIGGICSGYVPGMPCDDDNAATIQDQLDDNGACVGQPDADGDQVGDAGDNCPATANTNQANLDGDAEGDLCDLDDDNDLVGDVAGPGTEQRCVTSPEGFFDSLAEGWTPTLTSCGAGGTGILFVRTANLPADNCPRDANMDQADLDGDTAGDVCDADDDDDGVLDGSDNCPRLANNQDNIDGDLLGDACDSDRDGDAVENGMDNCPTTPNAGQLNNDLDAEGDACDVDDDNDGVRDSAYTLILETECSLSTVAPPFTVSETPCTVPCDTTTCAGTIYMTQQSFAADNCQFVANPTQTDANGDGIGDACDTDNDGVLDGADNCVSNANTNQADNDLDGVGDVCDPDDDNDTVNDVTLTVETRCVPDDEFSGYLDDGWTITAVSCGGPGYFTIFRSTATATLDNCQFIVNPLQDDVDGDGMGDACDSDDDGDTVADGVDNCPLLANTNQADNEDDGLGDVCDADDDNDGLSDEATSEPVYICVMLGQVGAYEAAGYILSLTPGDCVGTDMRMQRNEDRPGDNCPTIFNPDQVDLDGDGDGDLCDEDFPVELDLEERTVTIEAGETYTVVAVARNYLGDPVDVDLRLVPIAAGSFVIEGMTLSFTTMSRGPFAAGLFTVEARLDADDPSAILADFFTAFQVPGPAASGTFLGDERNAGGDSEQRLVILRDPVPVADNPCDELDYAAGPLLAGLLACEDPDLPARTMASGSMPLTMPLSGLPVLSPELSRPLPFGFRPTSVTMGGEGVAIVGFERDFTTGDEITVLYRKQAQDDSPWTRTAIGPYSGGRPLVTTATDSVDYGLVYNPGQNAIVMVQGQLTSSAIPVQSTFVDVELYHGQLLTLDKDGYFSFSLIGGNGLVTLARIPTGEHARSFTIVPNAVGPILVARLDDNDDLVLESYTFPEGRLVQRFGQEAGRPLFDSSDPSLVEVGVLDGTHIAVNVGDGRYGIFDLAGKYAGTILIPSPDMPSGKDGMDSLSKLKTMTKDGSGDGSSVKAVVATSMGGGRAIAVTPNSFIRMGIRSPLDVNVFLPRTMANLGDDTDHLVISHVNPGSVVIQGSDWSVQLGAGDATRSNLLAWSESNDDGDVTRYVFRYGSQASATELVIDLDEERAYIAPIGPGTHVVVVTQSDCGWERMVFDAQESTQIFWDPDADCERATEPPQCSDGVDNDGDGKIDLVREMPPGIAGPSADQGCSDPLDNDETDHYLRFLLRDEFGNTVRNRTGISYRITTPFGEEVTDGITVTDVRGDLYFDWTLEKGVFDVEALRDGESFDPPARLRVVIGQDDDATYADDATTGDATDTTIEDVITSESDERDGTGHFYGAYFRSAAAKSAIHLDTIDAREGANNATVLTDLNVTFESEVSGFLLSVKVFYDNATGAPAEVDAEDILKQLGGDSKRPILFIEVTGTENDGDAMDTERLNAVLDTIRTTICVPKAYFTDNKVNPNNPELFVYHPMTDGATSGIALDGAGKPVVYKLGMPVERPCGFQYTVTLDTFSTFAFVGAPAAASGGGGGGGGGGAPAAPPLASPVDEPMTEDGTPQDGTPPGQASPGTGPGSPTGNGPTWRGPGFSLPWVALLAGLGVLLLGAKRGWWAKLFAR